MFHFSTTPEEIRHLDQPERPREHPEQKPCPHGHLPLAHEPDVELILADHSAHTRWQHPERRQRTRDAVHEAVQGEDAPQDPASLQHRPQLQGHQVCHVPGHCALRQACRKVLR